MTTFRDRGVVLRTYKLGESDRIVVLMTRQHGKVRAVAKGIRKTKSKIGARLEPMSHVDVLLNRGRDLDVVNQVEVIDASPGLHGDLERMTQAISMCEAVDLVSQDRQSAEYLYDMLVGALRTLEDKPAPLLLAGFFLKLLAAEGVGPQVDRCVSCDNVDSLEHFDLHAGGVQCRSCATGMRIEAGDSRRPSTQGSRAAGVTGHSFDDRTRHAVDGTSSGETTQVFADVRCVIAALTNQALVA